MTTLVLAGTAAAIFAVAGTLRFWRLSGRGVLLWDDGLRMREAIFCSDLFTFLSRHLKDVLARKIDFEKEARKFRGRFIFENPLNIIIYALTHKVTGNIDNSALTANAVFSLLGIAGTSLLAWQMFGPVTALFAAFILTVSGYFFMYSRSVHAEVTSGAFLIWGTLFYWMSAAVPAVSEMSFVWIFLAGICAGCAMCANARQFHVPPLFVLFEILNQLFISRGFFFPRILILCTGVMVPVLVIQTFFSLLKEMGYPYWTFFKQLYERTGHLCKPDWRLPSAIVYIKTIVQCEGVFVPLLAVAGTVLLTRESCLSATILLAEAWLPLIMWSWRPREEMQVREGTTGAYQFSVPRLISSFIYAFAILAALALSRLPLNYSIPLSVVIALYSVRPIAKIMRQRAGYKKALDWIAEKNVQKHFTNVWEISTFFVGTENAYNVYDLKPGEAEQYHRNEHARYWLFAPSIHQNTCRNIPLPFFDDVRAKIKPAFTVELGIGDFMPVLIDEHNNLTPELFKPNLIEVYDLDEFYAAR